MANIKKSFVNIRNCIFGIHCEAEWEAMQIVRRNPDKGSDIKFCSSCQKEVYECNDDNEIAKNIKLNRCVRFYDADHDYQPLMGDFIIAPPFK